MLVLGGLAEFERKLIKARTGEGQMRAKAWAFTWTALRPSTPTSNVTRWLSEMLSSRLFFTS
jgi:hypothetical protein